MYLGIWSHERYISAESEVGSLQSTDALSGHVDVTLPNVGIEPTTPHAVYFMVTLQ